MPENDNGEGRPNRKFTIKGNRNQNQQRTENQGYSTFAPLSQEAQIPNKPGKSHEQLVRSFQSYIEE
jgi:hypothetical protein